MGMGLGKIFFNILPIFLVMAIGAFAKRKGYLPRDSIPVLNRLTFYVAIPAIIFHEISQASFDRDFNKWLIISTCFTLVPGAIITFLVGRLLGMPGPQMGTFIQGSLHGNLGFLGLAVCYHVLGNEGLVRASIIAGFLVIFQNLVSILALTTFSFSGNRVKRPQEIIKGIAINPIILASAAGILFSVFKIPIPLFLSETIKMVGKMAFPLALLVLGASLTFELLWNHLGSSIIMGIIKLILLPAMGLGLFHVLRIPYGESLPAIILLSSPTATVSYLMAVEMGGHPGLATTATSLCTALSILSYTLWVWIITH